MTYEVRSCFHDNSNSLANAVEIEFGYRLGFINILFFFIIRYPTFLFRTFYLNKFC